MRGVCVGTRLSLPSGTVDRMCEDVDSLAPECINCRRFCHSFPTCTAFMVRLETLSGGRGGQKGTCILMKGKITVKIKNVSPVLCYERGMKINYCNETILLLNCTIHE